MVKILKCPKGESIWWHYSTTKVKKGMIRRMAHFNFSSLANGWVMESDFDGSKEEQVFNDTVREYVVSISLKMSQKHWLLCPFAFREEIFNGFACFNTMKLLFTFAELIVKKKKRNPVQSRNFLFAYQLSFLAHCLEKYVKK